MEIIKNNRQRRKFSIDLSTMVYGKLPPQARELEEAVLGAIMLEKSAFDTVSDILQPECFYVDAHQKIFTACTNLSSKNSPIDMLTVVQELLSMGKLEEVGGPAYVSKLTNSVTSTANLEAHARILLQKFIQRELIRISGEIIGDAYEDTEDVFDMLDNAEKKFSDIALLTSKKQYHRLDGVMKSLLSKVEGLRNRQGTITTGVPTGIFRLNQITRGWQPGDFIVLAARPSIGKSAVAANFSRNAAQDEDKPTKVGIFSLEMSSLQWALRILSAQSELDKDKLNRGQIDDREMSLLYRVADKPFLQNIFIDDTAGLNIYGFKSKARKMVLQNGVGLIIVDYLQLMSGTGERQQNREQEISTISRNCKALAKELNVPIIALSQLSRAVETRHGNKQPQLSDLRESGAIEQDTDVVIFLVPIEENEVAADASLKDSIYVKNAKHRDGALDSIEVKFVKEIQKIMSRSDYQTYMDWIAFQKGGFVPVADIVDFTESNKAEEVNEEEGSDLPF